MATINAATNEKIVSIRAFLGLHESPDGDNKLKLGEATVCQNWKVTDNGNLKKRPGTLTKYNLGSAPIKGMWHGWVNQREIFVAACDNKLWLLMDQGEMLSVPQNLVPVDYGTYSTTNDVCMFGFAEKLYCLNGEDYVEISYYGNAWRLVSLLNNPNVYRPLVSITVPPAGGGELLEQVNKLTGMRRCWISPDGEGSTFKLPEANLQTIDYVIDLKNRNRSMIRGRDYDANETAGTVTFLDGEETPSPSAPPTAVNSFEIGWTYGDNYGNTVAAMKYAELYAGTQDNRVFLYGNGTNHAFYSGLDYDGRPRADYFPDLNEVDVGDANTPITGMIRHYSKLIAYKPYQTYSIDYGVVTLADTSLTPAFYSLPINKNFGNEAPGQVQLVLAAPRSLCQGNLLEWRSGSSYSANISMDERQAKVISDRIVNTLRSMDFSKVHCYDDNLHQEYYIVDDDGNALVHNYEADAWYYYTGIDARMVYSIGEDVYVGTKTGKILLLDDTAMGDDGESTVTCTGATIDKTAWETMISESGEYEFVYDGEHWYLGLLRVELQDYGITYTGVPDEGDKITVVYFATVPIDCKWESGSMDFGAGYMRKYSALTWVAVKSDPNNSVNVTVQTDRSTENTVVEVDPEFENDMPKVKRCKVKVKKFVYYKLKFLSNTDNTTSTVVDTEIKVRYTSQAK